MLALPASPSATCEGGVIGNDGEDRPQECAIWHAPDGTNPSGSAGQARASLAEAYRILLASAPHAAIATMAPPQVRPASQQNQATQRKQPELRAHSRPSPP